MNAAAMAALLSAGVPTRTALLELEAEGPIDEMTRLAIDVGAPLVPTLNVLQLQSSHRSAARDELSQAQAVPRLTRRLLLWLPSFSILLSQLMGLPTIQGLLSPLGALAIALSLGLLLLGSKVSARMLRRIDFDAQHPSEELIALQICISAGMGLGHIKALIPQYFSERSQALIDLSKRTGAQLQSLINSEIETLNQLHLQNQLTEVKKLSVLLLIPLTLTTLPAFLLLTIPPMLIGIAN